MSGGEYKIRSLGEYQRSVERFEKFNDPLILPDLRLVVRIDARRHGVWPKSWDYPYAPEIADALLSTARRLMAMGLHVQLALVHGDEISLLLAECESINSRRRSALLSLVASAGAVHFREYFEHPVIFHGILSELPTERHVLDYFFWQRRCYLRNVLSQALHRALAAEGATPRQIDERINPLTLEERAKLACDVGFDLELQPKWKRYGAAIWWASTVEGAKLLVSRNLPEQDDEFLAFLQTRLRGEVFCPEESGLDLPYEELDDAHQTNYRQSNASPSPSNVSRVLPSTRPRAPESAHISTGKSGIDFKNSKSTSLKPASRHANVTIVSTKKR